MQIVQKVPLSPDPFSCSKAGTILLPNFFCIYLLSININMYICLYMYMYVFKTTRNCVLNCGTLLPLDLLGFKFLVYPGRLFTLL